MPVKRTIGVAPRLDVPPKHEYSKLLLLSQSFFTPLQSLQLVHISNHLAVTWSCLSPTNSCYGHLCFRELTFHKMNYDIYNKFN